MEAKRIEVQPIFEAWTRDDETLLIAETEDPNLYRLIQLEGGIAAVPNSHIYSRETLSFLRSYLKGSGYNRVDRTEVEGIVDAWADS